VSQVQALFERWFKSLDSLGTGFAVAAILLIGIGSWTNLTIPVNLGIASLGAAVVAWGANAIQSRELSVFGRGVPFSERIQEGLARVWGVVFVSAGLLLLGYGILSLLNPRSPIPPRVQQFFATPQGLAIIALIGSGIGALFALSMILVSDVQGSNALVRGIKSLPGRFIGVILLLFFGALAAFSILTIFAPDGLQNLLQYLNPF